MVAQHAKSPTTSCHQSAGITLVGLFSVCVTLPVGASVGRSSLRRSSASSGVEHLPFSYARHGEEWTQGACASRDYQSPVNFDDKLKEPPTNTLPYHYQPITGTNLTMVASHGGIYVDMSHEKFGGVLHNGEWYPLVRIDFHAGAEHTIQGKRYPLEIQLVHRKVDNPYRYVFVSVLVWNEQLPLPTPPAVKLPYYAPDPMELDFNQNLQHFVFEPPPDVDGATAKVELPPSKTLDLSAFLETPLIEGSGTYLMYSGSFTSPPCLERAVWYVRRTTMVASDQQVTALVHAIQRLNAGAGNYRSVMPMNGRPVSVYKVVNTPLAAMPTGLPVLPLGPNPRTDDERRAELKAEYAQRMVVEATEYVKDFDRRVRHAAEGQYNALKGTLAPMPTTARPTPGLGYGGNWDAAVKGVRVSIYGAVESAKDAVRAAFRGPVAELHNEAWQQADVATAMQGNVPNLGNAIVMKPIN